MLSALGVVEFLCLQREQKERESQRIPEKREPHFTMNAKLVLRSSSQSLRQQGHAIAHAPARPLPQRLRSDRGSSLQIVAVKAESQDLQTGFRAPDFVVGGGGWYGVGSDLRRERHSLRACPCSCLSP